MGQLNHSLVKCTRRFTQLMQPTERRERIREQVMIGRNSKNVAKRWQSPPIKSGVSLTSLFFFRFHSLRFYPPAVIRALKLGGGQRCQAAVFGGKFNLAGDKVNFGDFPVVAVVTDTRAFLRKVALLFAVKTVFVKETA